MWTSAAHGIFRSPLVTMASPKDPPGTGSWQESVTPALRFVASQLENNITTSSDSCPPLGDGRFRRDLLYKLPAVGIALIIHKLQLTLERSVGESSRATGGSVVISVVQLFPKHEVATSSGGCPSGAGPSTGRTPRKDRQDFSPRLDRKIRELSKIANFCPGRTTP